jgi:uncharacterized protein YsxB (DUF464 family)
VVEVTIVEDSRGRLSSFCASGHAGWADRGSDVVCAAVSTLLQAAWLGLAEVAGVEVRGERSDALLRLSWPEAVRDRPEVAAIAATAARSIERLAAQYPGHVSATLIRS